MTSFSQLRPIVKKPKAKHLKQAVRDLAVGLGPGAKLPTVRDLCDALGVAKVTLDTALASLEADGVISRKHGSGLYVTANVNRKSIGLVFGSNIFDADASPVYPMLLKKCGERAQQHEESFSFYLDFPGARRNDEEVPCHKDLVEDIDTGRLHGILFTYAGSQKHRTWRRTLTIPQVAFLPTVRGPGTVGIDYGELVKLGVEALASQGCRRIALLSVFGLVCTDNFSAEHLRSYEQTLQRLGLEFRPEWVWETVREKASDMNESGALQWQEQGRRAIERMFGGPMGGEFEQLRPDGLVITDDMMALGALMELRRLGVRLGDEVRVATHANKSSSALRDFEGAVIGLEIDPDAIVEAMFAILESLMKGETPKQEMILVRPKIRMPYQGMVSARFDGRPLGDYVSQRGTL